MWHQWNWYTELVQRWQVRGFSTWSAWLLVLASNLVSLPVKNGFGVSNFDILTCGKWQWPKANEFWVENKMQGSIFRDVQLTSSRLCRLSLISISVNFDESQKATRQQPTWTPGSQKERAINPGEGREEREGESFEPEESNVHLPAVIFEGLAPYGQETLRAQGGEGNTRFSPYSEPGKTLMQLGQPTQLNQHRDIGMKHSSFYCSFLRLGIGLRNRNRAHFSWLSFRSGLPIFRSNQSTTARQLIGGLSDFPGTGFGTDIELFRYSDSSSFVIFIHRSQLG